MKFKYWLVTLSIIIILILLVCVVVKNISIINVINPWQSNNTTNYSNQTDSKNNTNINPTNTIDPLHIPPNDYVINNINWSKYPNLQKGYVLAAYKAGPNDVLNYEFIDVQICTEIQNTGNETLIYEQLAGIARDAKFLYGPASGINIHGTIGGTEYYCASILPYNDTVLW